MNVIGMIDIFSRMKVIIFVVQLKFRFFFNFEKMIGKIVLVIGDFVEVMFKVNV